MFPIFKFILQWFTPLLSLNHYLCFSWLKLIEILDMFLRAIEESMSRLKGRKLYKINKKLSLMCLNIFMYKCDLIKLNESSKGKS